MGEFLRYAAGVAPPGVGGKGLFGGAPTVTVTPFTPQFIVVGSNNNVPGLATAGGASIRDTAGVWHLVDVTTSGVAAKGLWGVTHDPNNNQFVLSGGSPATTALIGLIPDGTTTASKRDTGIGGNLFLTDVMNVGTEFVFGSLFSQILRTNLSSFSTVPSHGPGSYGISGIAQNETANSFVCVGLGSASTNICHSPDQLTWTQLATAFGTDTDTNVTANTIIFDGAQFVCAAGGTLASSTDGLSWTLTPFTHTSSALVIAFDFLNGIYFVGDRGGNVLSGNSLASLASSSALNLSASPIRCATALSTTAGAALLADNAGHVFTTFNDGLTWNAEDPGLGPLVLTAAGNTAPTFPP